MSQTEDILLLLKQTTQGITSPEAIVVLNCHRLAARIYDLRRAGYVIRAEREWNGLARYRLVKR